jgi:CheY-like chemotaxis protein
MTPPPDITPAALPVLLIEDEPAVMAYVRAALERSGYTVSDMRTPGGVDGADVHAWLSQHRPDLAARIVFITGDIANDDTVATLRKTGAPCVEKPFRVQQFISVIEKTMGKAP